MNFNMNSLIAIGITGAALWAAWKFGTPELKGMALGAAGVLLVNQLPLVRDGMAVRLIETRRDAA